MSADTDSVILIRTLWVRAAKFSSLDRARESFSLIHSAAQTMAHSDIGIVTMIIENAPVVMVQTMREPPAAFARRIHECLLMGDAYTPPEEAVRAYAMRRFRQIITRQTRDSSTRDGMVEYVRRLDRPMVMEQDGSDRELTDDEIATLLPRDVS